MTGTVTDVKGLKQTHCLLADSTGTVYFAHQSDFVHPRTMFVGSEVEFRVAITSNGRRPHATEIVAVERKAA
jgi:hypothetical protein